MPTFLPNKHLRFCQVRDARKRIVASFLFLAEKRIEEALVVLKA
jgi:hypothetical protein